MYKFPEDNGLMQGYKRSRRAILSIPGLSDFQGEYSGKLQSGQSGIVPFFRTRSGRTITPGGRRKNNFAR